MYKLFFVIACVVLWISPVAASSDYGPARWDAAYSGNYTVGRGGKAIRYVVIHVVQGSYNGCISWFKNPSARVSAHYVVSNSGQITQMVRESNTAWHAGNWSYNQQSIGIEHEGYVSNPSFPDAMYRSSSALVRNICNKYGIPKSRVYVIGHNEVPGATHTDPGSNWNWGKYMSYARSSSDLLPALSLQQTAKPAEGEKYKIKITDIQFNVNILKKTWQVVTGNHVRIKETHRVRNIFEIDRVMEVQQLHRYLSFDCHHQFPQQWESELEISYAENDARGGFVDLTYNYDKYNFEIWQHTENGWQKAGTGCAYRFKNYQIAYRK